MIRPITFFSLIMLFTSHLFSNPIDIFAYPMISEVERLSDEQWTVELGGCPFNDVLYLNNTDTILNLQFKTSSSNQEWDVSVPFNSFNIGLLTPEYFINIGPNEKVFIKEHDTVFVSLPINGQQLAFWRFVVFPVKPGHTLLGTGVGSFETSRPSIGEMGNYTTSFKLLLLDSLNKPFTSMHVYYKYYKPMSTTPDFYYSGTPDNNGWFTVAATIYESESYMLVQNYVDVTHPNYFWDLYDQTYFDYYTYYLDTAYQIKDTIITPFSTAGIASKPPMFNYPHMQFNAFQRGKNRILFIIGSDIVLTNAQISIYSLSGSRLASIPIKDVQGTVSIEWDALHKGKNALSAGKYICALSVEGKTLSTRSVTVQ